MSHLTAAICEDAHCLSAGLRPGVLPDKFCSRCGKRVFTHCQACRVAIRGVDSGQRGIGYQVPKFCPQCGAPYPWTIQAAERAKEAIGRHAIEHNVSAADVNALRTLADDLVQGRASEEQLANGHTILQRFGPAGAVLWDQLKDIAARTMAALIKPY